MVPLRISRSTILVTVLYGDEDVPGVRALLEGVAPDQNLAFLLFEPDQEDMGQRQQHRSRLIGATSLQVREAVDGGPLERSGIAFAPRARVSHVDSELLVSLRAELAQVDPDDPREIALRAVTSTLGRRGCVLAFAAAHDQLPESPRLRDMLGRHDGLVLLQREPGGPFIRLSPNLGDESPVEVAVQPAELTYTLLEHAEPLIAEPRPAIVSPRFTDVEAHLPAILQRVRDVTGQDFSNYKTATMVRRTIRRLHLSGERTAEAYLERLREERVEVGRLFRDLLVGVTAFFRDPDAFEALSAQVLERLATSDASTPARVWVAGCSTGEEVYTLLIMLEELAATVPSMRRVQLFATDVDDVARRFARAGRYPASRVANLTRERLARFFVRTGQHFQVRQSLRDRVVFSHHDLTRDPIFSQLDLIVCRNVLIYFDDMIRDRLLPRFHQSLRQGGTLFLGPSESLGGHESLFRALDAPHRLFTRADVPTRPASESLMFRRPSVERRAPVRDQDEIVQLMRTALAVDHAPRALVVSSDGNIVAVSGELSAILSVRDGAFVNSLSHLVHEGLRMETRAALREAQLLGQRVEHAAGTLRTVSGEEGVTVVAAPLPGADAESGLFLLVFRRNGLNVQTPDRADVTAADARAGWASTAIVERLEADLASVRGELLRVSHNADTVNEELKAANEELTSMNEELQAGMDELEASRQELERVNAALGESNTDLTNLLASTGIPTLFLDDDGTVRRINPTVGHVYNVSAQDIGRPIRHFTHNAVAMPPLPDTDDVYESIEPIEDPVRMVDGTVYLRRVQPYESATGERRGMVLTFTDVTERDQIRRDLHESTTRLRQVIDAMFVFVGLLDLDGILLEINQAPLEVTGLSRADVIGQPFWETALWTHSAAGSKRTKEAFLRARDGEAVRYDVEIVGHNNERITIDFMLQPVRRDGQVICVVPSAVDVTHRVLAEERLREQHELTRAITVNASTAILLLDGAGACAMTNPAAIRLLAFADRDLLGAPLHDLVHPSGDVERTGCPGESCEVARACAGALVLREFESVFIARNGAALPVAVSASAVESDRDDRPLNETGGFAARGVVFEVRDLTDTLQARQEVAEGESRFRQMADAIPQMAWIAGPDGDVLWYNRQFYEYTGAMEAELLGRGWTRLHDPDMLPVVVERWKQSIEAGTPFDMVFPLLGADGQYRPFITRVNPLRADHGEIRLWFGTNTDISEERERTELLRRNERQLQAITDALPDVITRFDREHRHVFVNAAMERVTGHRSSSVIGRTSRELGLPEGLCARLDAALGRVFASGEAEPLEFTCNITASLRTFAAWLTPELDPIGNVEAVLAVVRDRTAEVNAAEALEEAVRRKDAFLATLAHELRNPLAPMRNGLEILRLTLGDGEHAASTQRLLERQVAHMTRLIDDLLDVSRIRLGKLTLRVASVDLHRVVEEALATNEAALQDAGHEMVRALSDVPLTICADEDRVTQVVSNLVNNAIKYTPRGGRIHVSLGMEAGDAVIRVRDNGVGIEPDKLEHVFELFAQLPQGGASTAGLGIGLALVRQLVELHKGTVVAESAGLGSGSTFTVRLPAEAPTHNTPVSVPSEPSGQARPLRVLVVDDNEDSVDSMVTMLTLLGHESRSAHSGHQAMTVVAEFVPDLVFADIGLPDMTGYELAVALRDALHNPHVVLVALTGWGSEEHRRRSVDAGFDYHLTKPAAMDVIRRILARVTLELGQH